MDENSIAPEDYSKMFPEIDLFLHRPLLANPPMCTLNQLSDGTYSIDDVHLMNEIIELNELRRK